MHFYRTDCVNVTKAAVIVNVHQIPAKKERNSFRTKTIAIVFRFEMHKKSQRLLRYDGDFLNKPLQASTEEVFFRSKWHKYRQTLLQICVKLGR